MNLIGQKKYVIKAEDITDNVKLEDLTKVIDEVWARRAEIKKELEQRGKILREKALMNAKLVTKLLSEGRLQGNSKTN